MHAYSLADPELPGSVVHDLRQTLSTIEASAFYLNLILGESHPQAAIHVAVIQRQIGEAGRLLTAAASTRRGDVQRADENLDLTNSEIAAVT
jgi:hypothetical protein